MPTYEYRCTECGDHLEVVQSFADDPLTVCPRCEGRLKKVFNSPGISFKGSGFYKTDSRTGSSKTSSSSAASSGDGGSHSSSASDGGSSSESSSGGSTSSESSSTASSTSVSS
ncbi:MAG TPA: FmdB family zinc ribbon protein [Acidimicrobiales bacterium]|jgi:putative FmdB family regulatory protein|nr:FmdB family zinc ribbon protein [Acidimicrobiales bacterium]